jgi:hypothetical protein
LSDPAPPEAWNLAQLPPLARASLYLGLIMALGGPSCLVASSPEFSVPPPGGSAPFLASLSPEPYKVQPINKIAGTQSWESMRIDFAVFSDDQQRPLSAIVALDYKGTLDYLGNPIPITSLVSKTIPAGSYDSRILESGLRVARPVIPGITFTLPIQTAPGCHSVTLIVSHSFPLAVVDEADTARATWWLDVGDDLASPTTMLAPCVDRSPPPQPDGGSADGGALSEGQ